MIRRLRVCRLSWWGLKCGYDDDWRMYWAHVGPYLVII